MQSSYNGYYFEEGNFESVLIYDSVEAWRDKKPIHTAYNEYNAKLWVDTKKGSLQKEVMFLGVDVSVNTTLLDKLIAEKTPVRSILSVDSRVNGILEAWHFTEGHEGDYSYCNCDVLDDKGNSWLASANTLEYKYGDVWIRVGKTVLDAFSWG